MYYCMQNLAECVQRWNYGTFVGVRWESFYNIHTHTRTRIFLNLVPTYFYYLYLAISGITLNPFLKLYQVKIFRRLYMRFIRGWRFNKGIERFIKKKRKRSLFISQYFEVTYFMIQACAFVCPIQLLPDRITLMWVMR